MNDRRRLVAGALIAIAITVIAATLLWPSGHASSTTAGKLTLIAPLKRARLSDVSGPALNRPSSVISLRSSRPQFVDVWASWCVPCREEAPTLARLWRRYGARVRFLGIDIEDTRAAATNFTYRFGLGYPSIFDPSARLAGRLGLVGLPTAYLVDRSGRVAVELIGKQSPARLAAAVAKLAAEDKRNSNVAAGSRAAH